MNKKTAVWLVVILVVVVVVIFWYKGQNAGPNTNPNVLTSASPSPSVKANVLKGAKTPTPVPLTYSQAVQQYAGTRIQLNEKCQPIPSSMVIKKGTAVMFDNRSDKARTITFGTTKIELPGYGWTVQNISPTNPLPYNLSFLCKDSSNQGSGTMSVQANISEGF